MKRIVHSLVLCVLCTTAVHGQQADRAIREGNTLYRSGDLTGAAQRYDQAGADPRALFNKGNAFYGLDSAKTATGLFEQVAASGATAADQARGFHNLGNAYMQQKQYDKAVKAYEQALMRQPQDEDTRYNLVYAQKMLKQQQQQQQDQNKDDQKKKEDQEKKEQQEQQKQEEQQQGDQPKDKQEQEKERPKEGQPQQRPDQISRKDAERMLDALEGQEKEVMEKVQAQQRPAQRITIEKDW